VPADLTALLLAVVADKTGYPREMLQLSMDLEGDLGIDSIKRVEILERDARARAEPPRVDAGAMAQLRTLGQIVESHGRACLRPPSDEARCREARRASVAPSSTDLTALLMSVVADKTGYPREMLQLTMDLEGDLGIDSIKRVEILSAMREREPNLPEVDAGAMAQLRTLGQIVESMGVLLPPRTRGGAAATAAEGVQALRRAPISRRSSWPSSPTRLATRRRCSS
jgi:acyl carrier protein